MLTSAYNLFVSFIVPSAPPTDVNISISGLNIIVQWESVECIHHNGDITGYIIQYRENGSELTESLNISVNSTEREETLSGLSTAILYVIQVAAVNRAGVGPYSEPVTLQIPGIPHFNKSIFTNM